MLSLTSLGGVSSVYGFPRDGYSGLSCGSGRVLCLCDGDGFIGFVGWKMAGLPGVSRC